MNLKKIFEEWKIDSVMDETAISQESLKIPQLHAKYLTMMSICRLEYKTLLDTKRSLEMTLEDYYEGRIDGKDIGRPPWQMEETKSRMEKRILVDPDMVEMNLKIAREEEKVLVLKEIINNINQRNFQLKVSLDYLKWSNGG